MNCFHNFILVICEIVKNRNPLMGANVMDTWRCTDCGHVYQATCQFERERLGGETH